MQMQGVYQPVVQTHTLSDVMMPLIMRTRAVDELPRRAKDVPRPLASSGGPVAAGGGCGVLPSAVASVRRCLMGWGRCLPADLQCSWRCALENCEVPHGLMRRGTTHPLSAAPEVSVSTKVNDQNSTIGCCPHVCPLVSVPCKRAAIVLACLACCSTDDTRLSARKVRMLGTIGSSCTSTLLQHAHNCETIKYSNHCTTHLVLVSIFCCCFLPSS